MNKIGLTTTIPVEVLFAKGYQPVDLNNIFITSDEHHKYIERAERDGFPKSLCAWIKGIYGVCVKHDIKEIIGVMEGDCSNTKGLRDVLERRGIKVYPFAFPLGRQKEDIKKEIDKFMGQFEVDVENVENVRKNLNGVRALAAEIDRLSYEEDKVSGFENHLYQVSLSDFNGDAADMEKVLNNFIGEAKRRTPDKKKLRLGYIGVPPMTGDLYDYVEKLDAKIVYNEVQREFAFPRAKEASDIYEQYHDYTYPYDLNFRMKDIRKQIEDRKLDGLIHYTQAFCYRAIEDIVIKQEFDLPILHLEGDKLNVLDARTKLRIEAFLDMLGDLKEE